MNFYRILNRNSILFQKVGNAMKVGKRASLPQAIMSHFDPGSLQSYVIYLAGCIDQLV